MKFVINFRDKFYDCEYFDDVDFESLETVRQAYGFVFDDEGKICVVNVRHNEDGWCLPGGGPEDYDDNFESTLIREVDEEADLNIKDIKRIGYIRVVSRDNPDDVQNLLRYVARVDEVKEQTEDPCHGKIPFRKFVSVDEFEKVVNWGESGKVQLMKALEGLK